MRALESRLWIFSPILILAFSLAVFLQEKPIKIETELITVEVSVSNAQGEPVRNLKQVDFELEVNGEDREIDFFSPIIVEKSQRPLSIVFAVDVSGSITKAEQAELLRALRSFINRLTNEQTRFAVITFGMKVKKIQGFTNKPKRIEKALKKVADADDGLSTHAYDAIDYGIRMTAKQKNRFGAKELPRRVVIVISDGYPVGDLVKPDVVIERANNAETSVFAVILPSYSIINGPTKPVMTLLEASGIIDKTGGRSFYSTRENYEELFKALAIEIENSYAIAFYPTDTERRLLKNGELRIKAKLNDNSKGLDAERKKFSIKQNRSIFRYPTDK